MHDRWLSVDEVATYFGVKHGTLNSSISNKDLLAHQLGRLWKFKRDAVDKWMRAGRAGRQTDENSKVIGG